MQLEPLVPEHVLQPRGIPLDEWIEEIYGRCAYAQVITILHDVFDVHSRKLSP